MWISFKKILQKGCEEKQKFFKVRFEVKFGEVPFNEKKKGLGQIQGQVQGHHHSQLDKVQHQEQVIIPKERW